MTDGKDVWDDDEDLEEFLAAWDAADRESANLLRDACGEALSASPPQAELTAAAQRLREGMSAGRYPFDYFVKGCGWAKGLPDDDAVLWRQAAAATISSPEDPGTPAEEQAAVDTLMHADWFGMVVGLVRRGVGAPFDGPAAVRDIDECPEIEDDSEDPEGDAQAVDFAVNVLTPLWEVLGILDERDRLTPLGAWGLPNALHAVWTDEFLPG